MKILIIGAVASGKTTLARKLSRKLATEYYEIDSIVHDDEKNRKRTNYEQWEIIREINKNNSWILEGTLRKNLYGLLELPEKIIYMDIPITLRRKRIVTRYIKQKLGKEKSNYKPSLKMVKKMFRWTSEFEKNRKEFEEQLLKYSDKLIWIKRVEDIDTLSLHFD